MGHPSITQERQWHLQLPPSNACVVVPTPDNAEQSPRGVGSNQDCLSILTWRERELNLCKRRGTWTRGKGVP